VDTGSHSNQVYADCVDLSAVENASKQKKWSPVLIQTEPIRLQTHANRRGGTLCQNATEADDIVGFVRFVLRFGTRAERIAPESAVGRCTPLFTARYRQPYQMPHHIQIIRLGGGAGPGFKH
jgi:hypothetical protein